MRSLGLQSDLRTRDYTGETGWTSILALHLKGRSAAASAAAMMRLNFKLRSATTESVNRAGPKSASKGGCHVQVLQVSRFLRSERFSARASVR